jgi:molecular chaperone HscC
MSGGHGKFGRPLVGIDLGTTNSAIGILDGERVRLFENPLGETLTPSVVALDPRSRQMVVGRTARDLVATAPSQGAARFKIDMGTTRRHKLGEREMSAIELSAYVLDALRSDAERALGTTVTRCVITVPAYFDDAQRHATRQAAEQAGFVVERILNEPTAAAIAYGLHKKDDETMFAVVDLGGGTFDVCVMELFEGVLQVKGVAGESRLGGEDFTAALAEELARRVGVKIPPASSPAWALFYKKAETAKRALSRWSATEVMLPADIAGGTAKAVTVTAEEIDALWEPLVARLRGPLRTALRGAGVDRAALAEVILVGGATRMKCVVRAVEELLGRTPRHHADPDLLVAEGAAIQAAMIDADAGSAIGDMVVTDVASHSLGVDTARELGGRIVNGYFQPIIHRNTVIPTSQSEVFSTIKDNQREVLFGVYEGEAREVKDNRQIGELRVTGIPLGPAPKPVEVRFTYDQNGLLEVEAKVLDTEKVFNKVFERTGGELKGKALDEARTRLRALRADPMDRPRYRDLHARARLLWQELDPFGRAQLDVLIDAFQVAIDGRNPDAIEKSYAALLARCEQIDGGERW